MKYTRSDLVCPSCNQQGSLVYEREGHYPEQTYELDTDADTITVTEPLRVEIKYTCLSCEKCRELSSFKEAIAVTYERQLQEGLSGLGPLPVGPLPVVEDYNVRHAKELADAELRGYERGKKIGAALAKAKKRGKG